VDGNISRKTILSLTTAVVFRVCVCVCVCVCMCACVCDTRTLQCQITSCPAPRTVRSYFSPKSCATSLVKLAVRLHRDLPPISPFLSHTPVCVPNSTPGSYALPFHIHCSDAVCTRSGLLVLHRTLVFLRLIHGRDDGS
jgi:hypothetical protein